jgi:hypothetical protein
VAPVNEANVITDEIEQNRGVTRVVWHGQFDTLRS